MAINVEVTEDVSIDFWSDGRAVIDASINAGEDNAVLLTRTEAIAAAKAILAHYGECNQ